MSARSVCRGGAVSLRSRVWCRGRSLIRAGVWWSRSRGSCGTSWPGVIGRAVSAVTPMTCCGGGGFCWLSGWSGTRSPRWRCGTSCCGCSRPISGGGHRARGRRPRRGGSTRSRARCIWMTVTRSGRCGTATRCCGAFMTIGSSWVLARWSIRCPGSGEGPIGRVRITTRWSRFGRRAGCGTTQAAQTPTSGDAG